MNAKSIFTLFIAGFISLVMTVPCQAVEVTISDGLSNVAIKTKIEQSLSKLLRAVLKIN